MVCSTSCNRSTHRCRQDSTQTAVFLSFDHAFVACGVNRNHVHHRCRQGSTQTAVFLSFDHAFVVCGVNRNHSTHHCRQDSIQTAVFLSFDHAFVVCSVSCNHFTHRCRQDSTPTAVFLSFDHAFAVCGANRNHVHHRCRQDSTKTAVFLSFGRKKEKVRGKKKESLAYGKYETPVHTRSKRSTAAGNCCACGRFDLPTMKPLLRLHCRWVGLAAVLYGSPASLRVAPSIRQTAEQTTRSFARTCGRNNARCRPSWRKPLLFHFRVNSTFHIPNSTFFCMALRLPLHPLWSAGFHSPCSILHSPLFSASLISALTQASISWALAYSNRPWKL